MTKFSEPKCISYNLFAMAISKIQSSTPGLPSGRLGIAETLILRPIREDGMQLNLMGPRDHIDTRNIPIFHIIGDSWTYPRRMVTEYHKGTKQVLTDPHKIMVHIDTPVFGAMAYGYIGFAWFRHSSDKGLTYKKALLNQNFINEWANDVPRVTILHMGACFIANSHQHPDLEKKALMKYIAKKCWIL